MSKIGLNSRNAWRLLFSLPVVDLFTPAFDRVPAADIRIVTSYEDTSPILTVVGRRDASSADDRNALRVDAMLREEQIAYWKGLVAQAWNWVALPFLSKVASRLHSHPTESPPTRILRFSLYGYPKQSKYFWIGGK